MRGGLTLVKSNRLICRHPNPDIIIQGARHFCMMGDDSFLEEKLAFFRNFDAMRQSPGQSNVVFWVGRIR
jgi:hypothetical protein